MVIFLEFLIFFIIGIFAGITSGLLGLGGGIIIVPALVVVFKAMYAASDLPMHLAAGTSLAIMVFTSIASIISHHRRGAVIWPLFLQMMPGVSIGAALGAMLAAVLSTLFLKIIFAGFLLFVAGQMFFLVKPKPENRVPAPWLNALISLFIGVPSGMLGIGGGTLSVPYLTRCNISIRQASGTAASIGFPTAVAGTLTVIFTGIQQTGLPPYTIGYIYLPAVLGVSLGSVLGISIGAKLSLMLPSDTIKRVFAVFLLLAAVNLFD